MLIEITEDDINACLVQKGMIKEDPISFVLRTKQDLYYVFEVSENSVYFWYQDKQYIVDLPEIARTFLFNWFRYNDESLNPISFILKLPHE